MAEYYLAPTLVQLRSEIDKAHPKRDRRSDGWVGDPRHAASKSDHNPDYPDGGVVRALDVDKDGVNMTRLLSVAIANPATNYVIWDGHIYSRAYGFRKRVYTGTNKHKIHMHISLRHGRLYENRTAPWGYGVKNSGALTSPAALQRAVRTNADGQWGPTTDRHMDALRMSAGYHGGKHPFGVRFTQRVVGTPTDGKWGPNSIRAHRATTVQVQHALRAMGFDPGASGGVWGPKTEQAYQAARKKFRR